MGVLAENVTASMLRTPSAGLRVCANGVEVARRIAALVEAALHKTSIVLSLQEIERLAKDDYRYIALHLYANNNSGERRLAAARPSSIREVAEVSSLGALVCEERSTFLLFGDNHRADISAFLEAASGNLGNEIERRLDLPSRNAVFRDGVVKRWHLPSGLRVVSKRDNRRKSAGVIRELKSLQLILERFQEPRGGVIPLLGGGVIRLDLPIAVFRDQQLDAAYALWLDDPSPTLEDLLLDPSLTAKERRRLLAQCRRCLDLLFDHGVVWRDMSPRNILVRADAAHSWEFHLIDFEKVEVLGRSLNQAERETACRAQLCVEEFGVLCTEAELLEAFEGLFDPNCWDLQSDAPLPFTPRMELAALLSGLGVSDPITVGAFNRLDKLVYDVRRPRIGNIDGETFHPGLLGFRVEHYLSLSEGFDSAAYDRMTTDVLLRANSSGSLFEVYKLLWAQLEELETMVLVREFEAILREGSSRNIKYPVQQAALLCRTIDQLAGGASPEAFAAECQ